MALFDRYIAVDWSANNKPKRGPDSIWSCAWGPGASERVTANHATRREAEAWLVWQLVEAVNARERVLVGVDFPYGYPAGFAAALGVDGWGGVWEYLEDRIRDDEDNRSNRFDVAAEINARLGASAPFWGRPAGLDLATLPVRKDVSYRVPGGRHGLPEWRAIEDTLRSLGRTPQSAWKLAYTGSVGSQSLVGIPVVRRLRFHERLRRVSRVWPFEIAEPEPSAGSPAIVHAEIWPSLLPLDSETGQCRDERQVRAVVKHWLQLDRSAHLRDLFRLQSVPDAVRREEGWILGVPEIRAP